MKTEYITQSFPAPKLSEISQKSIHLFTLFKIIKIKIKSEIYTHGTESNLAIASGYDINASPVPPELITSPTSTFNSYAKFPRIPNMVAPANSEVNVSNVVTTNASLQKIKINFIKLKKKFKC